MSSSQYPVRNVGIYHNLPQFDPQLTGLTALITGANGISGFNTLRALLQSPQRWSRIYTLSRRPIPPEMMKLLPADVHNRIHHISCDLLQSDPGEIATLLNSGLENADVRYIFYYAYLQPKPEDGNVMWSNHQQLVDVNVGMLSNFLKALGHTNIKPKRFLLQNGAKYYGSHLGRARTPNVESDPPPRHLEPNFYYPQEDLLFEYCASNNVEWNIIRPPFIIGTSSTTQMNGLYAFAVFAAVVAQRGTALAFPGTWELWQQYCAHHGSALLTGYLSEWAILEDKCRNEAFNSQDTSPISWDRIFHELVRWFGIKKGVQPPGEDDSGWQEFKVGGGKDTPMGYGPPQTTKIAFSILEWAKDPENHKAWKEIMQRENLKFDPFLDVEANFLIADVMFVVFGPLSMNKARRLGWTGFVDTMESTFEMYQEMNALGMLPKMQVQEPRPLV
ncbi:hypothetical protein Z517_07696 [Fonsecaea pedrosoi CBS 271.37]|uniref:PRISE-like Rossmann-fold domain-containing protein n=1 Tax=Fonsecaea pedrosoi CBS 271.37 TaxID=1442368 RepID=A0A0D2GB59_9EURO|nr:uncharacterized protein Z517_07696 [Fonsecaea pedrosoi CBS 271.37]KIW77863.1 hypothetical protein Z517_07696 [Fonsecaea pedrosoi CBS 271.37]